MLRCMLSSSAVVIGFTPDTYNVNEGDGSVSITFGVLNGTLGVSVDVSVSTTDGSALCKSFQHDTNNMNTLLLQLHLTTHTLPPHTH